MANRRQRPWKVVPAKAGSRTMAFATRAAAFKRARQTALFEHVDVIVRSEANPLHRWRFRHAPDARRDSGPDEEQYIVSGKPWESRWHRPGGKR